MACNSLLQVTVLAGICLSTVAGQVVLDAFPTTEFSSYTRQAQDVKVAFTVKAPNRLRTSAPLSLTTVLDRSGSMYGRKLDLLKATNKFLINKLAETDGFHSTGVVIYGDNTLDLVELQPVTKGVSPLMNRAIDSVFAEGSTFLSGGLIRGLQQQRNAPEGTVKSVFLFTDGLPTIGLTSREDILREVFRIRNETEDQTMISAFGFGEDLDVQLLKDIAAIGGGQAYIISREEDIPIAFGDALGGLLSIVARDIDIVLRPRNGAFVQVLQSGGTVESVDGGLRVSHGNLFAGERRDLVLQLGVPADVSRILDVDLAYTDAISGQRIFRQRVRVFIDRSASRRSFRLQEPDPIVPVTALKFSTAEAIQTAQEAVANGDPRAARAAIAAAQEAAKGSSVTDDPIIQAILKDVKEIKGILKEDVRKEEDSEATPSPGGSLVGNVLGSLFNILTDRRGSASDTGDTKLASAKTVDTKAKKKIRKETKKAVLKEEAVGDAADTGGSVAGGQGSTQASTASLPGSRNRQDPVNGAGTAPMTIQALSSDAELLSVSQEDLAEAEGQVQELPDDDDGEDDESGDDDGDDQDDDGDEDDDDVIDELESGKKCKKNCKRKRRRENEEDDDEDELDDDAADDDGLDDDGVDGDGVDDDGADDDSVDDDSADNGGLDDKVDEDEDGAPASKRGCKKCKKNGMGDGEDDDSAEDDGANDEGGIGFGDQVVNDLEFDEALAPEDSEAKSQFSVTEAPTDSAVLNGEPPSGFVKPSNDAAFQPESGSEQQAASATAPTTKSAPTPEPTPAPTPAPAPAPEPEPSSEAQEDDLSDSETGTEAPAPGEPTTGVLPEATTPGPSKEQGGVQQQSDQAAFGPVPSNLG